MGNRPSYLIGLSGPPHSGKDTLGAILAGMLRKHNIPVELHALSLPMRLSVYGLLGLPYTVEHYDAHKDDRIEVPGKPLWTSIRQEMIALSETHVKPRLGHGWWGQALLNRRENMDAVVIVTDMGFRAEHDVFEAAFGEMNCAWPHIHRTGCDFSNDSRNYVGKGFPVFNNQDPDSAAASIYANLRFRYGWAI